MHGKFHNIVAIVLLCVFLLPPIAKLEHHHNNKAVHSVISAHGTTYREKCAICSFEFSVFLADISNFDPQTESPSDNYSINYNSRCNSDLLSFCILLRAPPADKSDLQLI